MRTYILTFKDKGIQRCFIYDRFGKAESAEKILKNNERFEDVQLYGAEEIAST